MYTPEDMRKLLRMLAIAIAWILIMFGIVSIQAAIAAWVVLLGIVAEAIYHRVKR